MDRDLYRLALPTAAGRDGHDDRLAAVTEADNP
jgi:hypothetical protein